MTNPETFVLKVPRDESGRRELLATRPVLWEYLYFGSRLYLGIESREEQWRDYRFGYAMTVGPKLSPREFVDEEYPGRMIAIVERLMAILGKEGQEEAFGAPGEPGDVKLIEHIASRFTDTYGHLLDWATEVRSVRIDGDETDFIEAREALIEMGGVPITECRRFVELFIEDIEKWMAEEASGNSRKGEVTFPLNIELPAVVAERYVVSINGALSRYP